MILEAIEKIGASKVRTISGELGRVNYDAFVQARNLGLTVENAVWATPLGKSARQLGFTTVTYNSATRTAVFGR
jgi:filamentous hemagglutinin